jgi:ribonuclease BN (tRNA processing enzyme)
LEQFARLEAILLTHLHADHTGDLAGMRLYPWGIRKGDTGPLPPIRVYGPPEVGELILSHYLPAEPDAITENEWAERAAQGFSGTTTARRDGMRRKLGGTS